MSLSQKNFYGIGDPNLTSMMVSMDLQRRSKQSVSLTHYDDNLEPKIAAGSIVELGGALLGCDADESITGWAGIGNDNNVYIKLVPSGTTATAAFVTAAPTWSTSKQGWYVGNDRYIAWLRKDSGGNYRYKHLLPEKQKAMIYFEEIIEIGDWDMDVNASYNVVHNLGANYKKIRQIEVIIRNDADTIYYRLSAYWATDALIQGGVAELNSTNIVLTRSPTPSLFDASSFETPPDGNRGWVYIKYRA